MGMSASQGRFLQLTSRKNDIGLQLTRLSNDKVTLSREMQKVSRKYQDSLNTKTLKWSNNAGVSYIDLSYSNLMSPSAMNQQQPYVLTDSSGAVVIASNYQKYAEMISSNGAAGGNWEANRTKILSELTGIDQDRINSSASYHSATLRAEEDLKAAKAEKDAIPTTGCKGANAKTMMEKLGASSALGASWKDEYSKTESRVELGSDSSSASSKLGSILNDLKSLAPHLGDYAETFKNEIDKVKNECEGTIANLKEDPKTVNKEGYVYRDKGKFYTNITTLVDYVLSKLPSDAIATTDAGYQGKPKYKFWANTSDYDNYNILNKAADDKIAEAQSRYDSAAAAESQLFTADEESKIAFYDAIFTAIADKGWTCNDKVTDTTYLNEMLQNGSYSITTMTRSLYVDGKNTDGSARFNYDYSTDIAVNNTHVYKVNDSDVQNEALVEYEHQKSIINAKETRIDTRMTDLQTEQSAIQQMLQGLEQVLNDNIERTFSVFS